MCADPRDESAVVPRMQLFDRLHTTYENLCARAVADLGTAIKASGLKVHDVRGRVKDRDSFRRKVILKRYSNPFNDMHDIVGIRVVCLFLEDLDTISKIVESTFRDCQREEKGRERDRPYRAVHYNCRLRSGGPEDATLSAIVFEVQIRTIGQDAWAAVEHELQYKGAYSIPEESRAAVNSLIDLFNEADRTFQAVFEQARQQDQDAKIAVETLIGGADIAPDGTVPADIELDRPRLKALVTAMYPHRAHAHNTDFSGFVEELAEIGIRHVLQLRDLLAAGTPAALSSEKASPPADEDEWPTDFADLGFAREALYHASSEFRAREDAKLEELEKKAQEVHDAWVRDHPPD